MSISQSQQRLNDTVIANGYCVGCGACAAPDQSPFKIVMDDYGQYQSHLNEIRVFTTAEDDYEKLCPFGATAPNEDEIAKVYFSEICEYNTQVGYYRGVFAGHVSEGAFRNRGSSGGMGTWIISELLSKGLVDYVIHVKSERNSDDLNSVPFKYQISRSQEEAQAGGKSRYYPIELSEVLKVVRNQAGRYAVVGLPCFIKSIRLLQAQDPTLAERIQYCVGLVCGHLKSSHYGESLAWQMGIKPSDLKAIDFRMKDPEKPANRYSTYAKDQAGKEKVAPTYQLFGADWGAGAFKYKACDFCDDVFAETADVALGDAWLPEYVQDSYGTNIVVTRNNEIHQLIAKARSEKRLKMDDLSLDKAARSQDAGLRHRKIAISYRLHCEQASNSWVPPKRTGASRTLSPRHEMRRQRLRSELRGLSHRSFLHAKKHNRLALYLDTTRPVYDRYCGLKRSFFRRVLAFVKRKLRTFYRL